jgi:hypothetical protein
MEMNENVVTICLTLVRMITSDEKSNLTSNTTYNETLLKIVESCLHSNTNYSDLITKTLCLIALLNFDSLRGIETQILKKIVKVTLIILALFPNQQIVSASAMSASVRILTSIITECSASVLQLISFDRYKCIQLVMQSMINFESNIENSDLVHMFKNNCSIIITKILNYEKSNLSSKPIYVKTLLEIIEICVEYKKTYDNLLKYCLTNILSETIEILVKERVFDLYFRVLKVSFKIYDYSIIQIISYVPGIQGSDRYRVTSVDFHFQDLNYF